MFCELYNPCKHIYCIYIYYHIYVQLEQLKFRFAVHYESTFHSGIYSPVNLSCLFSSQLIRRWLSQLFQLHRHCEGNTAFFSPPSGTQRRMLQPSGIQHEASHIDMHFLQFSPSQFSSQGLWDFGHSSRGTRVLQVDATNITVQIK